MPDYFRAKVGHAIHGDSCFSDTVNSKKRFAMIDPLGHGPQAHILSQKVCNSLGSLKKTDVTEVLESINHQYFKSRGLALSLAIWDKQNAKLEVMGIGNVNVILISACGVFHFKNIPSYIGHSNSLQVTSHIHKVPQHSKLLMFTDGIKCPNKFHLNLMRDMNSRHIVQTLAAQWNGQDDVGIFCEALSYE